jgi:putative endonuclease
MFDTPYDAICREKAIKKWYRKWKIELIEENNPRWMDLFVDGNILPCPVEN